MSDVFKGVCPREVGFTLRVGGAGSNINDRRNWDSYIVDDEVIRIQPKHALKIQGFPDDFILPPQCCVGSSPRQERHPDLMRDHIG